MSPSNPHGRERQPEVLAVTCAVIRRETALLAARRPPGKHLALRWELPGGRVRPDETPEACIVREIREELGAAVRPLRRLPEVLHHYPDTSVRLLPFECELVEGEPRAREHAEVRWVRLDRLEELDWCEADRPVLRQLRRSRS